MESPTERIAQNLRDNSKVILDAPGSKRSLPHGMPSHVSQFFIHSRKRSYSRMYFGHPLHRRPSSITIKNCSQKADAPAILPYSSCLLKAYPHLNADCELGRKMGFYSCMDFVHAYWDAYTFVLSIQLLLRFLHAHLLKLKKAHTNTTYSKSFIRRVSNRQSLSEYSLLCPFWICCMYHVDGKEYMLHTQRSNGKGLRSLTPTRCLLPPFAMDRYSRPSTDLERLLQMIRIQLIHQLLGSACLSIGRSNDARGLN